MIDVNCNVEALKVLDECGKILSTVECSHDISVTSTEEEGIISIFIRGDEPREYFIDANDLILAVENARNNGNWHTVR